jgi:hypothetical protein
MMNEANVKDTAAQRTAFDKMLALVPDVKEGSTLTFAYLPGKGTTLQEEGNAALTMHRKGKGHFHLGRQRRGQGRAAARRRRGLVRR